MGHLLRSIMAFKREMADFSRPATARFYDPRALCQSANAAGRVNVLPVVNSPNYYPSPDRYVPFGSISVTPFSGMAKNRGADFVRLVFLHELADSVGIITPNKGRKSCLRLPTSSQQPHFLASQLASTTTPSARLLARASVALLAKLSLKAVVLRAHLLAALSAHLPTTCKVTHLTHSTKITEIAAAGHPCARRFCF